MKHTMYLWSLAVLFAACGPSESARSGEAGEEAAHSGNGALFHVQLDQSILNWHGQKAFVAGEHNGTIGLKEGNFSLNEGILTAGHFEVDMATIHVTDDLDDEWRNKLEGHLASPDFFNTDSFPHARFAIVSGDTDSITANLTIKGITRSIRVPYTVQEMDQAVEIRSSFEIDRSEWNVRYGSGSFFDDLGDNMIKDEIQFNVVLNAVPNA